MDILHKPIKQVTLDLYQPKPKKGIKKCPWCRKEFPVRCINGNPIASNEYLKHISKHSNPFLKK